MPIHDDGIYKKDFMRVEKYSGKRYINYPTNVLYVKSERGYHPTQKPVELMKYLIKTYTKEGEVVLDSHMGSGTTGVASVLTKRHFIGIELEQKYFNIANTRINQAKNETLC